MLTNLLAGSPVPLFDKVCFRNSFGARKSRRAKLRDRGGGGGGLKECRQEWLGFPIEYQPWHYHLPSNAVGVNWVRLRFFLLFQLPHLSVNEPKKFRNKNTQEIELASWVSIDQTGM